MPRGKPPQAVLDDMQPDKVQQITLSLIELGNLGKCRTDTEVDQRIEQYFDLCSQKKIRPGVESLSYALSISRKTFYAWSKGIGCSEYRQEQILKAKGLISAFVEQAFLSGQINPVSGIFLLKNWSGYRDTVSIEDATEYDIGKKTYNKKQIASQLGLKLEEGDLEQIETDDL